MVLLDSLSPLRQAKNMSNMLNLANHIKHTIHFIHMYNKDAYTTVRDIAYIRGWGIAS